MRTLWMLGVVVGLCGCPKGGSSSSSSSGGGGSGFDASLSFDAGDIPDAAQDQDVVPPDSGPACGTVSSDGECVGDVLRYCDVHTLRESDCASRARACQLQPTLGGYWCVGAFGSSCEVNQVDVCAEGVSCVEHVCGGPTMDGGVLTDGGGVDGGVAASSSMGASSASTPASASGVSSSGSGASSSGSSGASVSGG